MCLELSLRDSPSTMVTPWKTTDEQSVAHGAAEPADLTKQHRFPEPMNAVVMLENAERLIWVVLVN